ncbi:hypothetical protein TTHERM_00392970 (macronuclear) [Tetrahymena thermophila SB210]|uniref:EGF-like domain-containing protein n=1 Tax=Tetrahymena thermophila (strain SB210) TaxID=312017 RepID=Q233F2_TETTS|nr:hypothetical protein TTHERM_00392970 [Tetrahymena thermophila SB210]EAR91628.1 hypothetical protein TTHERM_00392970 [Tetrahymena thermophila SB210]|eukprot:XP_001011873.1 hypothetical protein TTHERM_00392970 [Tetrahymena thermophila SB210]
MKNWQIITLLLSLVIVAQSSSTQSQQLQQICNFFAQQYDRFSTQYAPDISSQRCSFCQYSSDSKDPYNFAQGCSSCPNYSNGQCSQGCQQGFTSTTSNMCIPCPEGSTCCAGNNALSDPNFLASIQSQQSNDPSLTLSKQYSSLINYTGTRQVTCLQGYFAIGHVCQKLPYGCAAMTVQSDFYYCNSCLPGFYLDSNNDCSQNCQALYVPTDGSPFVGQCDSCISANKCAACSQKQNYYYLEPLPSSTLSSQQSSQQGIQVCTQCLIYNCIDCSSNSKACNQCVPYYYYDEDQQSCLPCPSPSKFITLNVGTTKDYYSGCLNGNKLITSYTFNKSIPQKDGLQQPANLPIIKLSDGTFSSCDNYCTQCNPTSSNGTICTACMAGYYLDQTQPTKPVCRSCPTNSLICQWNAIMKQPQVLACQINPNDNPPYSKTYYLQLDFTVQNYGENFQKYSPNSACVKNVNNCKEMINQNDPNLISLCASCYDSPNDFAVGVSSSKAIPYMMTQGKTCRQCNFPGALSCIQDPNNKSEIIIQKCGDGYRPTPSNDGQSCISCSSSCATCDDNGNCLTCNKQQRFTLISNNGNTVTCKIPYSQSYLTQGCIDWGQGTTTPSVYNCQKCSPNYILQVGVTVQTGGGESKANLCMSCPLNCQTCNQDNRSQCLTCSPGYYLSKDSCVAIPTGCASFNANGPNGGSCKYCQYGFRLMNDQYCSLCYSNNQNSFTGGQWFDCPGAQCKSQQNDEPQSSSSSNLKIISLIAIILFSLLV